MNATGWMIFALIETVVILLGGGFCAYLLRLLRPPRDTQRRTSWQPAPHSFEVSPDNYAGQLAEAFRALLLEHATRLANKREPLDIGAFAVMLGVMSHYMQALGAAEQDLGQAEVAVKMGRHLRRYNRPPLSEAASIKIFCAWLRYSSLSDTYAQSFPYLLRSENPQPEEGENPPQAS